MRRVIPTVLLCSLLLAACGQDPQEALLESYINQVEEISIDMNDAGTKFETLMNVQQNIFSWTDAEKQELKNVSETMANVSAEAEALSPPDILKDAHATLLLSMKEMGEAINGIVMIANDPSKATEALVQKMEDHANKAEALADEFGMQLDAAISANYPEFSEE